jgi:hypothetical protein
MFLFVCLNTFHHMYYGWSKAIAAFLVQLVPSDKLGCVWNEAARAVIFSIIAKF